ncbi:MAG TPA: response regulator transcription factor [Magnetospirillum sp.]|nr:response regulator transcription factor [Magnetospirillum sp.]
MSLGPILIVDDAPDCLELVSGFLEDQGLTCLRAASCAEAQAILRTAHPALIVLDVNLPDGDGISLARDLRLGERAGLIFLTSRDTDEDEVAGLEAGGDDYVTKPVNMRALLARIRSVLRRAGESVITFDGWILDLIRRELFRPNGQLLPLTSGEFNILAALAAQRPNPVSRDFLLDVISNRDPRHISDHTVDTLVARLRRKMSMDGFSAPIMTVRGIGYALASEPPCAPAQVVPPRP